MSASLVGSEMCIRDSCKRCQAAAGAFARSPTAPKKSCGRVKTAVSRCLCCLLYTSDAADDM
eukprot:4604284-Alexandrium_andersonii.AAC.1